MSEIYTGAPVAEAIRASLKERILALRGRGTEPCLAILRCGDDPAAASYERAARKSCALCGIRVETAALPASCSMQEVLAAVNRINDDAAVHGCLILRPLPAQIDAQKVTQRLRPDKDVDGVTVPSLASVFVGKGGGFSPCTPEACVAMLEHYGVPLAGARVAVIGRSLVVGRPLTMLLTARDATVTLCHSRTRELAAVCREADILIAAAGQAAMVDERFVREGQILLDVGVNEGADGKICGDIAFDRVAPLVRGISPVPRGVGTVTTAILARHVVEAAERLL